MSEITLPKTWTDFRIVETEHGAFTGQVYISLQEEEEAFNASDKRLLRDYTRQELGKHFGLVEPYKSALKTTED